MFLIRLIDAYVKRRYPDVDEEAVRAQLNQDKDQIGVDVAARFSRGNTAIQRGAFIMKDDLDEMKRTLEMKYSK